MTPTNPTSTPDPMAGYDTDAHLAAQAACHHVMACAVDARTRETVTGDLANATRRCDEHAAAVLTAPATGTVLSAASTYHHLVARRP
jgi:hypothetical protein